ncbi:unnamed protein product [Penicillium salamii]|uniref:Uncharacterized protein n=1 Tax=Penicillium salamii TaxID=1612424 RepID=A0A9W4J3K3_9EURO|nr:unnamed protein product [Penicillium salamii]CAG7964474.1 unnamed protein product [Penicillium salamii]CAG8000459.1 unnamed protein product [Penicillium salamii]CAG8054757.1 unnamed protein product [Penicillium salamii]CAG8071656.1 unnamed protein product [Penicillium salamii]
MSKESVHVAVIGAGISGVVTAGHLLATGIKVTVFERSNAAGGVWLYDKRAPIEAQYPSPRPSASQEYVQDDRKDRERNILLHAPPGPCYESLTNNVSTPLLRTKLNAWPEGTGPFVRHNVLKDYIQDTSQKAGVDNITKFGARVDRVYKNGSTWNVHWSTLSGSDQDVVEQNSAASHHIITSQGNIRRLTKFQTFDSVIVASGHYHTPLVPDIRGLAEAKTQWPAKIFHSKSFRRSKGLEGKNVLLIGGGVSAIDIAKEISATVNQIYQSTRNGAFDLPETALPSNATRIGEVEEFKPSDPNIPTEHLPLTAHIKSGGILEDIGVIILCTGYQLAFPFLDQLNDYSLSATQADENVLVTDGTQIHNLHKDIFYIPDPTLAFVGIPFYTATFSLFEFQAIAVVAFLSGVASLPPTDSLREEYATRLKEKGYGRSFHSLRDQEQPYVKELLEWVNAGRADKGLQLVEGHTEAWIQEKAALGERLKLIFAGQLPRAQALESPLAVEVTA